MYDDIATDPIHPGLAIPAGAADAGEPFAIVCQCPLCRGMAPHDVAIAGGEGEAGSGTDAAAAGASAAAAGYAALPVYSTDQIAARISGAWNGTVRRFAVQAGDTLTVDITKLTTVGGRTLAREALAVWSEVSGIQFREVTSGSRIAFVDNMSGAFTAVFGSGSTINSATVNVSTAWLNTSGTGLNSYSFQTYLHEIGHALGLAHAGPYNNTGNYATDAVFANDSWATTLMSYFSESSNGYFSAQGYTNQYVLTPTEADAQAVRSLYGVPAALRASDTVYGLGNNTGRPEYDAANAGAQVTIFDNGGVDKLDYSFVLQDQRIDLNPGTFSNVGGRIGNLTIARGAVIEQAIGGHGNDVLIGNSADNWLGGSLGDDVLEGRGGNDWLDGGPGADRMLGGTGDDTYVVDDPGDLAIELPGEGIDTVRSSIDYVLPANVERLILTGSAGLVGVGNALNNVIMGTAGDDILAGGGGHDTIDGGAGFDTLLLFDGRAAYTALTVNGALLLIGARELVLTTNIESYRFADGTITAATLAASAQAFDPLRYIASYTDLLQGFGTNATNGLTHFIDHGVSEGRGEGGFDALSYLASNADVAATLGMDLDAAERHWIEEGFYQGRATGSFDPLQYLATNTDLIGAIGTGPAAAETHYVQHGLVDGRATTGFDAVAYLLSSGDLATGGYSGTDALRHWVEHGFAEGRVGDGLFGREQTSHVAGADRLETATDRDWFAVTLAAGQRVNLNVHSADFAPAIVIADEHGRELASNVMLAGADATIAFTADHAATYYLTVASTMHVAGDYLVTVDGA